MASNTFEDKVVVITGASSGIGRELAHQLAVQGAWSSLAARDVKRLEMVVAECRALGGKTFSIRTEVSDPAQCNARVRQTVEHYGCIDVWSIMPVLPGGRTSRIFRTLSHSTDHTGQLPGLPVLYTLCPTASSTDQRPDCCHLQPDG